MDRIARVNELMQRELSLLVEREIGRDANCLVTLTRVDTTPDLRHSHIYISVLGTVEQKKAVLAQLHSRRKALQHEVSRVVVLKYTPILDFRLDEQLEKTEYMYRLLDKIAADDTPHSPPAAK